MRNKKNSTGVLILLVIFIILTVLLGGYIAYDKLLSKNETSENQSQNINTPAKEEQKSLSKNFSEITGIYTTKLENLKDSGEESTATVQLTLYENGIFSYRFSQYAPIGTFGNYMIDGDKIILTNWFNTASDVSLTVTKGTKTLTINSDGSITDDNIKIKVLTDNEITTVKLIRTDDVKDFNLSNRLGAAFFDGSNHTVSEPAI